MKVKLVYRVLRKISDWAADGFYSEVYITGVENVPRDGPLILASTHHNEIIDIATLAVTIPHRRQLCFWAKSTLFKNPITRAILISSGSIPVQRNPNITSSSADRASSTSSLAHAALFRETFTALASSEVIGVFPEGTSYTEPGIAQVKGGAAWAAVEFTKWAKRQHATDHDVASMSVMEVVIVPAGIVYTDKSQYQSRVCVRYGEPIIISHYTSQLAIDGNDDDEVTKAVVKEITAEIERRLVALTINSPDWDSLNAARMARDILWADEECINLNKFVEISQTLVNVFTSSNLDTETFIRTKRSLITYLALLHYTNTYHSSLDSLYPLSSTFRQSLSSSRSENLPTVTDATAKFLAQLFSTLVHPRALAFIPVFVIHLPAYILARLGARLLSPDREEETKAQLKVVFGGLGMGVSYAAVAKVVVRWVVRFSERYTTCTFHRPNTLLSGATQALISLGGIISGNDGTIKGFSKSTMGALAVAYSSACNISLMLKVVVNFKQLKRTLTAYKVLRGLLPRRSSGLSKEKLEFFSRPPLPVANPFITHRSQPLSVNSQYSDGSDDDSSPSSQVNPINRDIVDSNTERPRVNSCDLISHLFFARMEAYTALEKYLGELAVTGQRNDTLDLLRKEGARWWPKSV
ncbi:hypothetical protein SERLA73DRAFT_77882 [Serpula lacrymans var. lacrymans S7.3]|uniref:Phospholipid/glycerol acyltransferase domain-containing protein n=1 Tax=Serpula lacrymans var. lacrymans (strain S7.3) TaxID=936435 RepID=F8QBB0_SERL3|nr:hypothetical protein SERLA73DRAFT_77882 [Serpula lacrymans var. lacrymans S7.3]